MTHSKEDKDFNETLKRLMDSKPKPHDELKRHEPKPVPPQKSMQEKKKQK